MERMASSKYRDFIERALPSDLLAGNRHVGFAAVTGGDAPGIWGKPNWSFKAGIYQHQFRRRQSPRPHHGRRRRYQCGDTRRQFRLP